MSANSVNRETSRDALAVLLQTALVGSGLPAGAVFNYRPATFSAVPAVVVSSGGSKRLTETLDNTYDDRFSLQVFVFVPYAVAGSTWGPDNAEDAIDLIEKMIADVIMDNRETVNWNYIELEDSGSTVDDIVIGSEEFKRETIPVKVTRYQG
jgi:hypothetical protein